MVNPASSEASAEETAPALEESIWDILDEQRETANKVVSATKTEQKISDTPAVVAVISAPEIEARGYRSVAEAVRARQHRPQDGAAPAPADQLDGPMITRAKRCKRRLGGHPPILP